jgi:hypothetical protein
MLIYLPEIICLIGLVLYTLDPIHPKVQECGRIMFAFGLLVSLLNGFHHP